MTQALKSNKPVESKSSDTQSDIASKLNSLLSGINCQVISFDQALSQSESKVFKIQFPDGSKDEENFTDRAKAVKALLDIDAVVEHCRTVLQLEKDGYMSEESEREWIEDNIENEAYEIGYKIVQEKL